eukprot:gnl/Ergobibamus_cyprinoides/1079.p4 GENE.gnl/Ergobibamus_cyprinoides/1079~~gnl/Ergobibamus_cyprinoides/1079.p4  ORF type:complete len:161 (+),score=69.43 gnl/Ergobibamus_cyprinoides/1079:514-996(+)
MVTRRVLPDLVASKKRTQVVNVASLAAYRSAPGLTAYSASKAALLAATDALRVDLAAQGVSTRSVQVMAVAPYFMATPLFKARGSALLPVMRPEFVAERVVSALHRPRLPRTLVMPAHMLPLLLVKPLMPHFVENFVAGSACLGVTRSTREMLQGADGKR